MIVEPFGDIWLRDTGAIVRGTGASRHAAGFGFNGWGGKYDLPGDDSIGERLASAAGLPYAKADWILEGGAIDGDGSGTVLTTEQCLLNPNRNPQMDRADVEARLCDDLGFERIVWLGEGLANDHTDGHVDNLARFVAPGRVAIPIRRRRTIPTRDVYRDAARRLRAAKLDVVNLPSPGRIEQDGEIVRGELHELLHRQRRRRRPAIWRAQRRGRGRGGAGLVPRSQRRRPSRRPCANRRRKLPLHQPAGARIGLPHSVIPAKAGIQRQHESWVPAFAGMTRE